MDTTIILTLAGPTAIKVEHSGKGRPRPDRGPGWDSRNQQAATAAAVHPPSARTAPSAPPAHIRHPRADQIPRRDRPHGNPPAARCHNLRRYPRQAGGYGRPVRHKRCRRPTPATKPRSSTKNAVRPATVPAHPKHETPNHATGGSCAPVESRPVTHLPIAMAKASYLTARRRAKLRCPICSEQVSVLTPLFVCNP